jgi:8-oxo-dGTP pyrophosphatase MutT (NUDIX family)
MAPEPPAALTAFTYTSILSPFTTLVSDYLISHPERHRLVSSAFVFSPSTPTTPTRLLILQRSATDYLPHLWETPGGSCDHDESILAATVRELWEESGLVATEVKRQVGNGWGWVDGEKKWYKFNFEVVVEGMEVKLDEVEHQAFLWVSEEECRRGVVVRGGERTELEWTSEDQIQAILEGFQLKKED